MKHSGSSVFFLLVCLCISCGIHVGDAGTVSAPVVVYKTKKDYRDRVSVQLSADKRTITAYPAPSDVPFQKPIELDGGYLLKRMVGDAYLSLTIEEYAGSSRRYSAEDLLELVVDMDPYLEIFDCSGCCDGDTASLNELIRKNKLSRCKTLR